jgi:hypothetical protein
MAGLASKDKEALTYIYELNEFKSFKRWCKLLSDRAKVIMSRTDMRAMGASETVAGLQGQIHALENLEKEWQLMYKSQVAKATKDQPKR